MNFCLRHFRKYATADKENIDLSEYLLNSPCMSSLQMHKVVAICVVLPVSRFKFHPEKLTFHDAEAACQKEGSHLVKIDANHTYTEVIFYLGQQWIQ